jgi:hypothetical protein
LDLLLLELGQHHDGGCTRSEHESEEEQRGGAREQVPHDWTSRGLRYRPLASLLKSIPYKTMPKNTAGITGKTTVSPLSRTLETHLPTIRRSRKAVVAGRRPAVLVIEFD